MSEQSPMTLAERDEALRKVDSLLQQRAQRFAYAFFWDLLSRELQPLHGRQQSAAEHVFMVKGAANAALAEWREKFQEVPDFAKAIYDFTVQGDLAEQAVTITPSPAMMLLMHGSSLVRMPVPPLTDGELRKLVEEVDLYTQTCQSMVSAFEAFDPQPRGTIH